MLQPAPSQDERANNKVSASTQGEREQVASPDAGLTQAEQPVDVVAPSAAPVADAPAKRPLRLVDVLIGSIIALLAVTAVTIVFRRDLWKPSRQAGWPPDPPETSVPDWPILGLAALVIWFAQQMGAASARLMMNLPPEVLASLKGIALISLGGYGGAAIGAAFVLGTLPGLTGLIGLNGWRRSLWRDARAGAIAFILVFPIVLAVGWIASTLSRLIEGRPPEAMAHETLKQLADPTIAVGPGALWWWMTVAGVTIGAPLAEEIVYRGFLQTSLRRMLSGPASALPALRMVSEPAAVPIRPVSMLRRWAAIFIVAGIFTFMHAGVVTPHALATLFVLALGFGVAHERTGRLIVPIVMHVLFNAANVLLAIVMP